MTTLVIRDAVAETDAAACAGIYRPYVLDTPITFEEDPPPSPAQFTERIRTAQLAHAWLVATLDDVIVGYAYGGPVKDRAAYRFSTEVSVYLDRDRCGAGAGTALYTELLARLTTRGYRQALGVIALPNPASVALHRRLGFQDIGVMRQIGWKLGAWHDVGWYQRPLGDGGHTPPASVT